MDWCQWECEPDEGLAWKPCRSKRASTTGIDEDLLRGRFLATTPERCTEVLRPFLDLGVGDFLMLARPPADERTMELFATQVAPTLRE